MSWACHHPLLQQKKIFAFSSGSVLPLPSLKAFRVMFPSSAAKRKSLSRFGAFVRTTARQSIRPAKILNRKEIRKAKKAGQETPSPIYEPSKAGEAPRTRRAGQPIKRILFGYEPDNGGNAASGVDLTFGGMTGTPGRLERGGSFTNKRTGRTVTVAKRPTLVPALAKEKSKARSEERRVGKERRSRWSP